jgi:uncharacterized iron-regulated membrane protein
MTILFEQITIDIIDFRTLVHANSENFILLSVLRTRHVHYMNSWQNWMQAPQTHWFRKLLFQVHLWMGIGFGLYVLTISLSGSALLLKSPFYTWFEPRNIEPMDVTPLEGEALTARMAEVYAGYELGFMSPSYEPDVGTYIVLNKDGEYIPHYFNQYTGEDVGLAHPWPIQAIQWVGDVHEELMLGRTGRKINGVGGVLFVLMSLSGVLIWWQGRGRWFEGLQIKRHSKRMFMWQLHSFIGFWSLLLMFAWGISGFQIGFPQVINATVDWFSTGLTDFIPLDNWFRFFRRVHFARYGETSWARWGWIIVSFLPTVLFISGFTLWWQRVVLGRGKSKSETKS